MEFLFFILLFVQTFVPQLSHDNSSNKNYLIFGPNGTLIPENQLTINNEEKNLTIQLSRNVYVLLVKCLSHTTSNNNNEINFIVNRDTFLFHKGMYTINYVFKPDFISTIESDKNETFFYCDKNNESIKRTIRWGNVEGIFNYVFFYSKYGPNYKEFILKFPVIHDIKDVFFTYVNPLKDKNLRIISNISEFKIEPEMFIFIFDRKPYEQKNLRQQAFLPVSSLAFLLPYPKISFHDESMRLLIPDKNIQYIVLKNKKSNKNIFKYHIKGYHEHLKLFKNEIKNLLKFRVWVFDQFGNHKKTNNIIEVRNNYIKLFNLLLLEPIFDCSNCVNSIDGMNLYYIVFSKDITPSIKRIFYNSIPIHQCKMYLDGYFTSLTKLYFSNYSCQESDWKYKMESNISNVATCEVSEDKNYVRFNNLTFTNGTLFCIYNFFGKRVVKSFKYIPYNYKKSMSSNDSANKNVIIPDPYQFIKFKKKGSITYSDFSTILILGIVFGSLLLILPSCALSIFIIHKYKEIKIRRQKNVYLNIETFFETYKDADFDDYVKYMLEKEYVPEKLTKETFIQTSIAGEVIVQGDSHLFDDTLVSIESIKNLGFCAHYINSEYDGKKYILCDGPTKDSMHNFWKMIYYQNISTIIINIFEEERGSENYEPYWLEKEFKFDSFNVSRISGNTPSIKYINTFIFSIKQSEEETRYVTIFLINKWADNTLPKSFNFLISLYENIEKESDNSPILIHGSDEPSSKVFIILYFICIVNSFTINKNVSEPLDIMAMIRKQKYGGLLSAGEYLFLCGGVINYFIKKKMIQEDKSTEEFMKKINEYIYGANIKEILMDRESKSFLKFITNMSSTKLVGYVEAFVRLNRKVEDDEIKKKCSLWYTVQREEIKDKSKRRLRYKDSPCWDEFNILNNSKEGSKKDRFIHANEFKYKTKNNTSRTLILSEAPIPSIFHDFYELIYTKNVYIIIMLVDKHEETKNWDKYYPGQKNEINEGKYRIEEIRGWRDKLKNISTAKFELYNKFDKITIEFKIIHLKKWELNNELPSDIMDICNLYKVIEFIDEDKSILIHCSNGFGRTGMIAYIIHMIDNAKLPIPFDPIRDFREVRRHRFGAVISVNQFIYSLMIVCHYFKKQIDRLGQDYYFKWISALDNLYKITYLMHQNLDTLININKKVETKPNEAEKNEDKSRDD